MKTISFLKIKKYNTLFVVTIVFLILLSLTISIYFLIKNTISSQLAAQFQKQSNEISSLIEQKMSLYVHLTDGGKGLFAASVSVEKDEWNKYVETLDLPRNYAGVSSMGYIEHVPQIAVSKYPNKIYPDIDKPDYYPVKFLEPQTPDRVAIIGFDVSSEEKRWETLGRAMDTGKLTSSPLVMTVTDNPEPSFSVYAPMYNKSMSIDTVPKRRLALLGFINVTFRTNSLFKDFENDPVFNRDIDIQVYDSPTLADIDQSKLIFDSRADFEPRENNSRLLTYSTNIVVGGRAWTLLFTGLPGYNPGIIESMVPLAVLVGGGIFSFLLAWLVYSFASARERAVVIAQEITKDLKESKEDLQNFLDGLSTFVVKVSTTGRFLLANKIARDFSGLGDGLIGADFFGGWFSFDEKILQQIKQAFSKALAGVSIKEDTKLQLITPQGKVVIDIDFSLIPVMNNGSVAYVIAEGRDISKDKRTEKELAKINNDLQNEKNNLSQEKTNLQKFKLAVDNSSEHITITDLDGIIIYANKSTERITGFEMSEILGQKAGGKNLWGGHMDPDFYKAMWKITKIDKKIFHGQIKNRHKSGTMYDADITIIPLLDDSDNILFFVEVQRDITKEKEVDKAKTEFVSLASHQLRTPLSSINWYTELLLAGDGGPINKQQKEFLEQVYSSNQRMVDLVDALLSVSRIDLGTLSSDPKMTNIAELVESVILEMTPKITEGKITLKKNYKNNILFSVDLKLMRIVIQNLLSNAIKYTPSLGTVTISLKKDTEGLHLTFSDTGYGIPSIQQNMIFTKLFRADNAKERIPEGTGLGLYIVKSIIETHGGAIRFESEENKGSTFYVDLPVSGMKKNEGK